MRHYHFLGSNETSGDIGNDGKTHTHIFNNIRSSVSDYSETHTHLINNQETSQPMILKDMSAVEVDGGYNVTMPGSGVTKSITKKMSESEFKQYLHKIGFSSINEIDIAKQFGNKLIDIFEEKLIAMN